MEYLLVKWLHILSSTVLFGTGIGSAFYLLFVSLTREVQAIAVVNRHVVLADWWFTTPTVILQPMTGFYLIHLAGFSWSSKWIVWSLGLYAVAIACWLPVVWIQIKMRDLARSAASGNAALPTSYWRYLQAWVLLGIPAFIALVMIFYLMVAKPA